MPLSNLFGLIRKRQTDKDKFLFSSVNVLQGRGQAGAVRQTFNQHIGINSFRSWVYAAATINAQAVASIPIRLYAKKNETEYATRSLTRKRIRYLNGDAGVTPSKGVIGKAAYMGEDMEEVVGGHPLLDLLQFSNPYINGFDFTSLRVLYGELTGNAYLHPIIDEASGQPCELWPLAPQYVEVIPCEDEFIEGYLYGIDASKKQVFEPDEVVHFKRPNPGDMYYGLGKVEAAYGVIRSNEEVHKMDLAMFENSARPDYAVVVKGNATHDQLDRFQYAVEEKLRGTRKDGKFLTVTGDVQFTPLNFPPKDLTGREEIVEEIAAVFGVPVSMLKANDPNLASAQTGFAAWREMTVLPLCRMDEEQLNQSLLPLFGLEDTHCLAYDNPVPSDKQFELTERQTAVAGGWRTPNEARFEEGKEPIKNEFADQLLVGGQPLGGAVGGGGIMSAEPEEVNTSGEDGQDLEFASSLLQSLRGRKIGPYTATKMLQRCGFSRAVAEKMVEAEKPEEKDDDDDYEDKALADIDLRPTEQMASLAERGLDLRKEHGRGGTMVGVSRARDIKNRENLSPETVGRMANFFGRHEVDLDAPAAKPSHDNYPSNGVIAWLLWGGDPNNPNGAGAGWAKRKMEEIRAAKGKARGDSRPAKPSERIEGSDRNPEGSASGSRGGIEISETQETALKNKVEEHNEEHGDKKGKKVDLGMLKAVYRRAAGAFSTSHRPGMTRVQWSMGRVNAFLYLVRNGKPERANYTQDNDLLPKDHPKYSAKDDKKEKGYEDWPEETKRFRLNVEGLDEDFPVTEKSEGGSAEDTIRDEDRTPAQNIYKASKELLEQVADRIIHSLRSGEIKSKSIARKEVARSIVNEMAGTRGTFVKRFEKFLSEAAKGGGVAGRTRLDEVLGSSGSGRLGVITLSESVLDGIQARSEFLVDSMVGDTIDRFVDQLDATFSIEDEVDKIMQTSKDFSVGRAKTIARTESAQAYHTGQVDAWKQTGAVTKKHFLKAPGACKFCEAVHNEYGPGKKTIDVADPVLKSGQTIKAADGSSMSVKLDSFGGVHPNCRCDVVAVVEI